MLPRSRRVKVKVKVLMSSSQTYPPLFALVSIPSLLERWLRGGRPDILKVAMACYQSGEPGLRVVSRGGGTLLEYADKGLPHVRRHARGLATDEDHRLLLEQTPHVRAMVFDRVLHVGLRFAGLAREDREQPRDPGCFECPHLILVEEILQRIAAAEEQHRLAHGNPALLQRRTLLEKAPERRNAGAGPDHDHRYVRVVGRAKRNCGLADKAKHGGIDSQPGQVVRADTLKSSLAAACGCLQHTYSDAADIRGNKRRGRYRVVSRP